MNTLSLLRSGRVWFAGRAQLNDPFDCYPELHQDISDEELVKYFESKTGHRLTEVQARTVLVESYNAMIDDSGVFCVSATPLNELMWAHYAENHSGLAIGLGFTADNHKLGALAERVPNPITYSGRGRVKYSDIIASSDRETGLDALRRVLSESYFRKNKSWEYEEEARFLSIDRTGLQDIGAEISSVVFGLRCPIDHREIVTSVAGEGTKFQEVVLFKDQLVMKEIE